MTSFSLLFSSIFLYFVLEKSECCQGHLFVFVFSACYIFFLVVMLIRAADIRGFGDAQRKCAQYDCTECVPLGEAGYMEKYFQSMIGILVASRL